MRNRFVIVAAAVVVAVVTNLIVYAVGRAAGGSFRFTTGGQVAEVNAVTVAGFSAVPLLIGLTVVALLAPRARWVLQAAMIAGPVLALVTIVLMTLPTDLDTASTVALSACHVVLAPIVFFAVRAIGRTVPAAAPVAS